MHADDEPVHCLACAYDLRGMRAGPCPECGKRFDPDDPTTFGRPGARRVRRWDRWLRGPAVVAAVLPVLVATGFGVEYMLAWERLGHPPDPNGLESPAQVRSVRTLHLMVAWSLVLSPVLTGLLMIASAWFVIERAPGRRWWTRVMLAALGSWALAAALWAIYPPEVNRWWFD